MPEPPPPQSSEDLALVLKELEQKTERLKHLYEAYFMGIERMEPQVARKEVTRAMLTLQQQYIRNTALRFKFNTMLQRWSMYTTYWNRTLREIENGTYVRHVQKAARNAERKGLTLPSEMRMRGLSEEREIAVQQRLAAAAAAEAPPAKPSAPPGAKGAVPPPLPPGVGRTPTPPQGVPIPTPSQGVRALTPGEGTRISMTPPQGTPIRATPPQGTPARAMEVPGMSEAELRALHKRYQDARHAAGDAATVRYETLVASLAKQVPKVLERPGVKGVRFDVEIKEGKPILKAIPTK